MEKNQLAIVIPYYKIDFFEETIKSVAEQTDQRFTLYIGNDASPNNPLPIIEKYFPEGNYHYYDYKENVGGKNLALQWERILENVKEEWVEILGDDDVLEPLFVAEFYKTLPEVERLGINLIKVGFHWIDEKNAFLENNVYNYDTVSAAELFEKKYHGKIRSSLSENIYKTKIVQKKKFVKLPLAWGSDDCSLLDFSNGKMIKYIPMHLLNVRVFSNSISGSDQYDQQKELAIQELRRLIATQYHSYLPTTFVNQTINDYLYSSYQQGLPYKLSVVHYYLKKGRLMDWLKSLKKSYYIYFKINNHK